MVGIVNDDVEYVIKRIVAVVARRLGDGECNPMHRTLNAMSNAAMSKVDKAWP